MFTAQFPKDVLDSSFITIMYVTFIFPSGHIHISTQAQEYLYSIYSSATSKVKESFLNPKPDILI